MKGLTACLCILTGTAIGFGTGYFIAEKKYTKMLDEEINKTNDILSASEKEAPVVVEEVEKNTIGTGILDTPIYSYISSEDPPTKNPSIEVVPFDDFEKEPEYESEVIFYYPDVKEFYNDRKEKLSDVELIKMIGKTNVDDDFNRYYEDPDCIRVRNDDLKTYYEILRYYTSP